MPVQHKKTTRKKGDEAIQRLQAKLKEARRVIAEEAPFDLPSTAKGSQSLEQKFPVVGQDVNIRGRG